MNNNLSQWSRKDFTFHEQLGVGKYGVVFKANEKKTGFMVAIKVVPKKKINSQIVHKRLQRQIQIHSRLKQPNICRMYGYFLDEHNLYMVMQYCENGNLFRPVKVQHQKFSYKKIASIIRQLLSAIGYLAHRNIIHRDIKLQNILFDADFNIKLTDFGCCVHTSTNRSTFCGTVEYLCPQMLDEQEYGQEIDYYCLGIVLYELFFFSSPFYDLQEEKILEKIKESKVNFNDQIRQIPDSAKKLILDLLRNNPKGLSFQQLIKHQFLKQNLQTNEIINVLPITSQQEEQQ